MVIEIKLKSKYWNSAPYKKAKHSGSGSGGKKAGLIVDSRGRYRNKNATTKI